MHQQKGLVLLKGGLLLQEAAASLQSDNSTSLHALLYAIPCKHDLLLL
jgi:hypothetical protein